ncbi:MAG: transglutaminase domain-containing protein [Acetatifactor sp.]
MKKLHFDYSMEIEYSLPVTDCHYTIKCIPCDTARQRVEAMHIDLMPPSNFCRGKDGLGNRQIYGVNEEEHRAFSFHIAGNVVTGLAEYEEVADPNLSMIFRHPHGLNVAGENLRAYYFDWVKPPESLDPYRKAMNLMNCLHRDFVYRSHCTTVDTTAEEAFSLGCGVCQDYAHILIALLHLAGIGARYVTGLIVGEGASHAWVEILCGEKWVGLDPTNNLPVAEEHIRLGIGRDAKDCMINRGIMHGGGTHTQRIHASVTKLQGEEQ